MRTYTWACVYLLVHFGCYKASVCAWYVRVHIFLFIVLTEDEFGLARELTFVLSGKNGEKTPTLIWANLGIARFAIFQYFIPFHALFCIVSMFYAHGF